MKSSERSKVGFWILVGVLTASGVSIAFIAAFGLFGSVAYSLVWRVFVADLYLIASFAAQHAWLRRTAWGGVAVTFVLGIVNIFWQYTPYYEWADGRVEYTVGDYSTGWSPWFGFEQDLENAAHFMLTGVITLGFISLAYRWIVNQRLLLAVYRFVFVSGALTLLLGAFLILDDPQRWNVGQGFNQVRTSSAILALTGAAIVIIGAFVERKAARARKHDEQGSLPVTDITPGATTLPDTFPVGREGFANPDQSAQKILVDRDELRQLVNQYVDERLLERGQ